MTSRAHVNTEKATAYIGRLCKHFAYWNEASAAERTGSITFQQGTCELVAGADQLTLVLRARGREQLANLQAVVAEQLEGLGAEDELRVRWEPSLQPRA